jgi:hypothetical protein
LDVPPERPADAAAPAQSPAPAPSGEPDERAGFTFSGTPEERAKVHANRLLAAPEDPTVRGYPAEVVRRADAGVALGQGPKPVVILFYDDTARASNLQAAEFLPVLARHRDAVDVVAVDVSSQTTWTPDEKRLVRRFYVAYVPTTVVLGASAPGAERKPLLLKYQRISGAMLDATLARETRR